MPSFMSIELKLWALEGYRQTNKQTDRQSYSNYIDSHQSFLCRSIEPFSWILVSIFDTAWLLFGEVLLGGINLSTIYQNIDIEIQISVVIGILM